MSLILDALKKSEAERQLGRAPGLTSPMPLRRGETGERARSPLRYALWLAIVAMAIAAAWWLARGTRSEDPAAEEFGRSATSAASTGTRAEESPTHAPTIVPSVAVDSSLEGKDEPPDVQREPAPAPTANASPAVQAAPRVVE